MQERELDRVDPTENVARFSGDGLPSGIESPTVPSRLDRLAAIAGIGLVAGALEVISVAIQRGLGLPITMASLRTNQHFVWMIPVADTVFLLGVAGLLAMVARARIKIPALARWQILAGLVILAPLLAIEGLYGAAAVVLASGIGLRLGPLLARLADRRKVVRGFAAAAIGTFVVAVASDLVYWSTAESRARAGRPPAARNARNVLLIVLDNVRAASLSLYGYNRPTSPRLDALATTGVTFGQARSTAPWTLPSHASMFTGQWCGKLSVGWDRPLDSTYPTLAEHLAAHGYATAGFVGNTFYCNSRYGLDRGFDRYEDFYENRRISPFEVVRSTAAGKRLLPVLGYHVDVRPGEKSSRKTAAMLNSDVLNWLDERESERPFFVFVNYFDAHSPFLPPDDATTERFGFCAGPRKEQDRRLARYKRLESGTLKPEDGDPKAIDQDAVDIFQDGYESCIAYLDDQLSRLFDALRQRRLLDDTIVIITSDHGEHFKEHGFLGHGLSVYRRELEVPLVVLNPAAPVERRHVDEPVSLRDIPATVVDLIGLGDSSPFPGQSLASRWKTRDLEPLAGREPLLSEVGQHLRIPYRSNVPSTRGPVKALMIDGKEYIRNGDGREELYNLASDPHEKSNLIQDRALWPAVDRFRLVLEELVGQPYDAWATSLAGKGEPARR